MHHVRSPLRIAFPMALCALVPLCAPGELQLPSVFGDHMVLQRGRPVPIWGKTDPGASVTVAFNQQTRTTIADTTGSWTLRLDPLEAGGPYVFRVSDGKENLEFRDVLVGEVWLCSGQSNMEWPVEWSQDAETEIGNAKYPLIHLFKVGKQVSPQPKWDVEGTWKVCDPQTVPQFSAVGYFFSRDLHKDLDVPVGMIESAWGGTPAEAWTSREVLLSNPVLAPIVERFDAAQPTYERDLERYKKALAEVESLPRPQDIGTSPAALAWAKPDTDDRAWKTIVLPGLWSQRELPIDGAVWFRKRVKIPSGWVGKNLQLSLGAIDDYDITYVNGTEVGHTGKENELSWISPRVYPIPADLVTNDRLVIAVRVFDAGGEGGFSSRPDLLFIQRIGETAGGTVSIAGSWKCQIERQVQDKRAELAAAMPAKPIGPGDMDSPAGLYHAMILPLVPYAIRGVLWYQGESNANRARQYRVLFPALIRNWRHTWCQGDFPFLYVQLANFLARSPRPTDHEWAELREAQAMALSLPSTAMAVAIDIGDPQNIHPQNKQEVGRRLERAALALAYSRGMTYSGPLYRSMTIEGSSIRLHFDHVDGGLVLRGDNDPKGFAIAGKNRKFVWADVQVEGDTVVVTSPEIAKPVAVRYGWDGDPVISLFNEAGFPASPFRTDDWPGVTDEAR